MSGERRGHAARARLLAREWWRWYLSLGEMGPHGRLYTDSPFADRIKLPEGSALTSPEVAEIVFSYLLGVVFHGSTMGGILFSVLPSDLLEPWHCFAAAFLPFAYCLWLSRQVGWRYHMFFLFSSCLWPLAILATPAVLRARDRRVVQEVMEQ